MTWTCPDHGDYPDNANVFGRCPSCDQRLEAAARDLDRRRLDWHRWQFNSGVPARFQNRTLDNWLPQPGQESAAEVVQRYAADIDSRIRAGDGLTLLGPPGLGKTHLISALVSIACAAGRTAWFASWPDLLSRARAAAKGASGADPLRHAADVPLLAIDELALGTSTQWAADAMFELVDRRYREQRSTLIATNSTLAAMADTVGERLADRLREMNTTVLLAGDSMRDRVQVSGPPAFPEPPAEIEVHVFEKGVLKPMLARSSVRFDTYGRRML